MSALLQEHSLMATATTDASVKPATATPHWMYVVSHTDPRYGGLSSAVPTLAASLRAQTGTSVSLAAFCLPGEHHQPADLCPEQVRFWPTSRKSWLLDRTLKADFADAVRTADGLHVHGLWEESTAVACSEARRQGKPYVLSAHGMLEPWALANKQLKKRVYAALVERANVRGAGCLHALTLAEAAQYCSFGARGPIAVIPNAVEIPPATSPALFLDAHPELAGKRLVLFLSRFHQKKGLDLLVEAWARVASLHPEAHLVLAGPDADGMTAELRGRCRELGIEEQVSFPGMLAGEQKWSALAAAEAFVLPSRSEGLSMALLEAMGMGLPVIATRACNMPEITEVEAGWEPEPAVEPLAEALRELLQRSPADNQATGRHGAALVAEHYGQKQITEKMAAVYRFLLGDGPCPAHVQTAEERQP